MARKKCLLIVGTILFTTVGTIHYNFTSWGKPKIPPADRILMGPGHKASMNPSNNADLGF